MQHIYFGDSYLVAKKDGAAVKYKIKNLPAGRYDVYKWNAGENLKVSKDGENEWVKIGTVTQFTDGRFQCLRKMSAKGDIADSILLIKQE